MESIPNWPRLLDNGDDEHRESEQELQGSAMPYLTILEHMPASVLALDMQWRIIYLNQQAESFLQKTKAELLGSTIWEAIPNAQDTSFFQYCQQSRTTGKVASFEQRSSVLDMWFEVSVYPSEEGICIYFQDITQRKHAEGHIQESERRFKAIFNQSFTFLGVMTSDGLLIDVNELALIVTGFQREHVMGLHLWETGWWRSLPQEGSILKEAVSRASAGQTVQFEIAYHTSDGKKRLAAAVVKPLRNEDGGVVYVIAEGSDITERKHAEERLQQSEKRFRSLIEHNVDGIALADAQGIITYVSPSTTRIEGYFPDELVGHRLFQSMVHPDDYEAARSMLARVFEEPGKSHIVEFRGRHKNGTFQWLEAIGINLLHEPGVEAIVWNYRDITQRKQLTEEAAKAKEQLEAILHNVVDGILVADHSGSVVYVNDVAARTFGFSKAAEMLAVPQASLGEIFSRFPKWDVRGRVLPFEEQPIVQALQGKKAHALIQYQDMVTDQRHWILVKAQPIVDIRGPVQFVVSVSTDITEQKEFEEQRDEFIMSVSHELRTPLTAVIGFLELLRDFQDRLDPSTQTQFLSKALENCLELKHLVNSVLDALLASDATHAVQLERLVVGEIVREVLAQFDPDSIQAYTLTVMISEDVTVWADKEYLQQVLRNLLSNAFKYAPQQTPILLCATHREADSQATASVPQVCISVQDAGPGIPLAEQPRLFQKFKRLKRDLTSTVRGTGLGLYICKQLVEMMEGHIWVESSGRAGEGSRFCFTLPEAELLSPHE